MLQRLCDSDVPYKTTYVI